MKKILVITLAFAVNFSAQAADGFSTLEERMTGKEFKETGLVKLTDEELAALNDWIRRRSVATLENVATPSAATPTASTGQVEDTRGFENRKKDAGFERDISSTIVGTFDGWRGIGTQFTLSNGMVWQQIEADTFHVKPTEDPEVIVKKTIMGGWRLSVVGHGSSVRVRRIK